MNEPLVSIENLHVRFRTYAGPVHAVNGVSLDIKRGEVFGLVGETGCGKTVTGLSLLRLVPPPGEIVAGRITFEGQDILSLSEQKMQNIRGARIAMIFQDPAASLNPVFSVGEQIEMVIRQHQPVKRRVARRRTLEMLEAVGLPDPPQTVRSYPHELSGGDAAAGDDRPAPGLQRQPAHRRRADHRSGRDHSGPDSEPSQSIEREPGAVHPAHHSQSGRGGRDLRSGGRAIRGPRGGERLHAGHIQGDETSLHSGTAGGHPPAGQPRATFAGY